MEDVHVKAWNVRESKERKNAIFNGTPTSDNTNDSSGPIYPWPQYLEETTNEKSKEKYELRYPGNVESLSKTKAYRWDLWPEVEFVEEFIKGYIERTLPAVDNGDVNNQKNETSYITLDAIQTPILSEIYQNKDEVKFIYEIYERIFVEAFYSKLGRGQSSMSGVYQSIAEAESSNIVTALGYDNPFLIVKLKNNIKLLKEQIILPAKFKITARYNSALLLIANTAKYKFIQLQNINFNYTVRISFGNPKQIRFIII
jgi:hypothetical protein